MLREVLIIASLLVSGPASPARSGPTDGTAVAVDAADVRAALIAEWETLAPPSSRLEVLRVPALRHRGGEVRIEVRGYRDVELRSGEMAVIPRDVEHRPMSESPSYVLMFEPLQLKSKGD